MRWARISIKLGVTVSGVWPPVSHFWAAAADGCISPHLTQQTVVCRYTHTGVDISTLSRYTYLYYLSIVFVILRQIARYCQAADN